MLRKFNIRLPDKFNLRLSNHVKEYNILPVANRLNFGGKFDIFIIGADESTHIRLVNVRGKWVYTVIKPSVLVGGDVEQIARVEE